MATEVPYESVDWTPTDGSRITDALYEIVRTAVDPYFRRATASHKARAVGRDGVGRHRQSLSYRPHLPANVISDGILSDAQLESIIYAGEAHSAFLAAFLDGRCDV